MKRSAAPSPPSTPPPPATRQDRSGSDAEADAAAAMLRAALAESGALPGPAVHAALCTLLEHARSDDKMEGIVRDAGLGALCVALLSRAEAAPVALAHAGAWVSRGLLAHVTLCGADALRAVLGALQDWAYMPDEVLARAAVFEAVQSCEGGCTGGEDGVRWLDMLLVCCGEHAAAALEEVTWRACCLMGATGQQLYPALRKLFICMGKFGTTDLSKAFHGGMMRVVEHGSAAQRRSALALGTLVLAKRFPSVLYKMVAPAAHTSAHDAVRTVAVESMLFMLNELRRDAPPALRGHLCVSAAQDASAEIRALALDALFPLDTAETAMGADIARTLSAKLFDRSAKVRKRAAAALRAWGAARISQSMSGPDVAVVLQCAQTGCVDISALLLEFVTGPRAVHWLRTMRLLQDERFVPFMRAYGPQFLPKMIYCVAPASQASDGEGDGDEVCVALPDSQ